VHLADANLLRYLLLAEMLKKRKWRMVRSRSDKVSIKRSTISRSFGRVVTEIFEAEVTRVPRGSVVVGERGQ